MKTQIVLGTFFGDEGKGSTVQWLCKQALDRGDNPIVIRFSGGQQAGHRIITDGKEHVCSSFGAGVLLGVPTYLDRRIIVDPICMISEYESLLAKGVTPEISINHMCRVTTPYDVQANVNDSLVLGHGSCGMGIFHTIKRCGEGLEAPFDTWETNNAFSYVIRHPKEHLERVRRYYGCERKEELEAQFVECCQQLRDIVEYDGDAAIAHGTFYDYDDDRAVYIFEGSQGLLLDMDCGFMPHCTPSRTGLNGISKEFLKNAEVYLVMRTYLTRHGNGYVPSRPDMLEPYMTLEEPTNPFDDYQGVFKCGLFDFKLLERVCDRHRLDNFVNAYDVKLNVALTHLDCLHSINQVPCIHSDGVFACDSISHFLGHISFAIPGLVNIYGSYSSQLDENQFHLLSI